jgi:hypothetical protein
MGTGVFGGMIIATFIAPIFVPLFFTLLARKPRPHHEHRCRTAGSRRAATRPDRRPTRRATHDVQRGCGWRCRRRLARRAAGRLRGRARTTSAGVVAARAVRGRRDVGGNALAEVPSQWWTLYGQPELDRLVGQALERNRDIEQAVARVEQADALARQAGAGLLPRVDLNANAGRARVGPQSVPAERRDRQPLRPGPLGVVRDSTSGASCAAHARRPAHRCWRAARQGHRRPDRRGADGAGLVRAARTRRAGHADPQHAGTREEGLRLLTMRLQGGTSSQLDVEQARGCARLRRCCCAIWSASARWRRRSSAC